MTWPFENNTSKIERKLARRSLAAQRPRNLVAFITIGLVSLSEINLNRG